MRVALGIDAAWTDRQPSGVALAVEDGDDWRLVATASSYQGFYDLACDGQANLSTGVGALPDPPRLLAKARALCGASVDVVAVDMPLANAPITGRRAADNAVSAAYGGRACGTHSPSEDRPGEVGVALREGFMRERYMLRTRTAQWPGLIEVYPHPALVELTDAPWRLPYKVDKMRRYWPSSSPLERRVRLRETWTCILARLEAEIAGVAAALPLPQLDAPTRRLKAYEDALDAAVCAWVAICALQGRAQPFGDEDSAIWIPRLAPAPEPARPSENRPGRL